MNGEGRRMNTERLPDIAPVYNPSDARGCFFLFALGLMEQVYLGSPH